MLISKLVSIFIISICSFQMCFADVVREISSIQAVSKEDLLQQMDSYKQLIRGNPSCSEEEQEVSSPLEESNKDQDYYSYIEDFKRNSCTSSSKNIVNSEKPRTKCKTDKLSLVESISKELSKVDIEDSNSKIDLRKLEGKIISASQNAMYFKNTVQHFLLRANAQESREVVISYISNVVVALRDLKILLRPYSSLSNLFERNYFVDVKSGIFEEFTDDYDYLALGKDPSRDPYFINIEDDGDKLNLSFDEHSMTKRDIQTISQFPMAKNYLYALRMMTIQMMASQIKNYDVIAGEATREIEMPRACVENKANGNWPEVLDLKVNSDVSEGYLDSILENHGLVYNMSNDLILNYYIEDSKINPLKDSLYGSVEFNNYTNANKALNGKSNDWPYLKATFDDTSVYADFIKDKKNEANSLYYYETNSTRKSKKTLRQYKDVQLLSEIIGDESPYKFIEIKNGKAITEIRPFTLNASPYLSQKLEMNNVDSIKDLIDSDLKNILTNNKIKVAFPSLYSPNVFRNWGINKLHTVVKTLVNEKAKDSKFVLSFAKACHLSYSPICKSSSSSYFEVLNNLLNSLRIDGQILPLKKLNELDIQKHYGFLFALWIQLRDTHGLIPEAVTNEYDYLIDQMNALNPIAKNRLGYLIARKELVDLMNGTAPSFKRTSRGSRVSSEFKCHRDNLLGQIKRLDDAAKILHLNKIVKPNFMTSYLDEDTANEMWSKSVETSEKSASQLFTAKLDDKKVYNYIQNISYKTILSKTDTDSAINDILKFDLSDDNQDKLDQALDSQSVSRVDFFRDLMKEKTHKARLEMYKNRAAEFGIQDDLDLKEQILSVDMNLKRSLYREVLQRAAKERRVQTMKKLEDICLTDESDHEGLKEHFFGTMKVQNELNQMIGLQGAPEEIMNQVQSMSNQEWVNTGLAVGGFLVGMAGVMLAGSCAVVTGGLCGIAVAGLVTAGMGAQGYVVKSEVEMKYRADESVGHVSEMADLGFTNLSAANDVSRSWAWSIIEGVSIIPLVGLFVRGVTMGAKMTKESVKSIILNSSKASFSDNMKHAGKSAKTVADEADVNLSKVVLGFSDYSSEFKSLFGAKTLDDAAATITNNNLTSKQALGIEKKISKLKRLHLEGQINSSKLAQLTKRIIAEVQELAIKNNDGFYKYTSDVVTDMSVKSIDKQLAKTVSTYFGKNPSELRGFMGTYAKKFLPRTSLFGAEKLSKAAKAKAGYEAASEGQYLKGTNWIRKAWYENTYNLAKNESDFLRIYDELSKVPANEFESYILKNVDILTDVFVKAPLRKRDLPYLLIQGGPHVGGLLKGRRLPGIQEIGEAVVIRKIFNARARLISESAKATAREVLGANKVMAADTLSHIFKAFYTTARQSAKQSGENGGKQMLQELANIRKVVLDEVFDKLSKNEKFINMLRANNVNVFIDGKVNKKLVNNLLYESSDIKSEVYADMLWALVDTKNLFKIKDFEFIAYKVMRETVSDTTTDGISKYLSMVKVLLVKDQMGAVELF